MAWKTRFSKSESARKAITQQQLKEINKLYKDVYKQMEQKQKDLASKTTYSSGVQRLYLDQFKKDMQAEMSRVNSQVKNIVQNGATKVAQVVVDENNELLKSMGLYVNGAFSYVPTNAVRAIINGSVYNGQWSLSKAIWGSNQKNIKSIENIVAAGLAGNKSIKEITKDLVGYSKSGNAQYNATRLAKTMSNHAYQKAYQMTTEKNPFIEAYQWNNGNYMNVCPLCLDLATRDQFGLGNGVFPKNEIPLDHPNGACYITSIVSDNDKVDQALLDWINGTGDAGMNAQLDEFARDMGFMPQVVKNAASASNNIVNGIKFDNCNDYVKQTVPDIMNTYTEKFGINSDIKRVVMNESDFKDLMSGAYAYIKNDDNTTLYLNPSVFKSNEELLSTIGGRIRAYHSNADANSIIAHELSHSVGGKVGNAQYDAVDYAVSNFMKNYEKTAMDIGLADWQIAGEYVSRYSTTTKEEFFAESFADVFQNGESANQISKDVVKYIREHNK